MKSRDLNSFFNPKSIAIIGASDDEKKVGGILVEKLKKFDGKLIPINPKHTLVKNLKCYSSVLDYTEKIDLAVVAIPSQFVENVLIECGKKKIKNIIIITSGFSEVGNKKQEENLIGVAKKYDLNILGPNCFGIVNPFLNLDCTFANSFPQKGNTAFISQSGALWSYVSELENGFSGFVSLGNMSDLGFYDWIEYFEKDKNTKKIVLYVEKIKDGKKFIETCRNSKKEIIAVKSGKTEKGLQATVSHTGSLATDFEIYRGAFKQANVELKNSISEVFYLNSENISIKNKKIILITNAGGVGALLSDYFSEKNSVEKSIDILGTATANDYKNELEKHKNFNGIIVVILTPQTMSEPEETAQVISEFAKENKKEIVAYFLGNKSIKTATEILRKNKIKVLNEI